MEPDVTVEVGMDDLIRIIGAKEIELLMLKRRVHDLEGRIQALTAVVPSPEEETDG